MQVKPLIRTEYVLINDFTCTKTFCESSSHHSILASRQNYHYHMVMLGLILLVSYTGLHKIIGSIEFY